LFGIKRDILKAKYWYAYCSIFQINLNAIGRNIMKTLILGIGNLLWGDEGIGVHAARELLEEELPEGTTPKCSTWAHRSWMHWVSWKTLSG
jgi:hypothetical protein